MLVDGALAIGHVPVDIRRLGCDYYAGNFHKWAGGMPGTGVLYVRPELIGETPPLFGSADINADGAVVSTAGSDDVRKFEQGGRYEIANILALEAVFDLHRAIGSERIQERLSRFSLRWRERATSLPGFRAAAPPRRRTPQCPVRSFPGN